MRPEILLEALDFLDDEYLTEAEIYTKDAKTVNKKPVTKPKRIFMIAAVIVLMLSLIGCGVGVIYLVEAVFEGASLPEMPIEDINPENVNITIKDVTPIGMTVYCSIDDFDAENFHTKFTEGSSFTLEKKTETGWAPLERKPGMEGAARTVLNLGEDFWPIEWTASYGMLEPGDYRITLEIIKGLEPMTAEFSVENEPPEIESIEALTAKETYHLRYTSYLTGFGGLDSIPEDKAYLLDSYEYYLEHENFDCYEYWKSGENFLRISYNDAGMPHTGQMYLDGKKYRAVNETPGDSTTPIVSWEEAPDLDFNHFKDPWLYPLQQSDNERSYEYDREGNIAKITIKRSEPTATFEVSAEHTTFIDILPSGPESIESEFNSQKETIIN